MLSSFPCYAKQATHTHSVRSVDWPGAARAATTFFTNKRIRRVENVLRRVFWQRGSLWSPNKVRASERMRWCRTSADVGVLLGVERSLAYSCCEATTPEMK